MEGILLLFVFVVIVLVVASLTKPGAEVDYSTGPYSISSRRAAPEQGLGCGVVLVALLMLVLAVVLLMSGAG